MAMMSATVGDKSLVWRETTAKSSSTRVWQAHKALHVRDLKMVVSSGVQGESGVASRSRVNLCSVSFEQKRSWCKRKQLRET